MCTRVVRFSTHGVMSANLRLEDLEIKRRSELPQGTLVRVRSFRKVLSILSSILVPEKLSIIMKINSKNKVCAGILAIVVVSIIFVADKGFTKALVEGMSIDEYRY